MTLLRRAASRLVHISLAACNRTLVRRDSPTAGEEYVHAVVRRLGVDLVLDVGANAGYTGQDFRRHGYTGRIVSFEPQPDVFTELQAAAADDPRWECRREGLGAADGGLAMQVSGFSPSSSLLPMAQKHVDVWPASKTVGTVQVPVRRLDGLADELRLTAHRTLLKIDTQGYESAVLAGAAAVLPLVRAAYVELLFAPLYDGQARYFEVMATLEAAGLRFAGLYGGSPDAATGYLLYADGLFVREAA